MIEHGRMYDDPIDDQYSLMRASSYPFRIAAREEDRTAVFSDMGIIDEKDVALAVLAFCAEFTAEQRGGLE